ncbi:MAG: sulfite exporter TauE/SafE family protein [Myxococcales bacterium]|nr:sulfite exporter TauE/SafE family protein [Polyangiaceae bacterium]MDW8248999.1 sulfite exporter TauE/SafE family protein [Myxococcales bacterium]
MWVLGVLLAGLIGISLGLLGGGGSILTVPILLYVFRMDPKAAIATSLLVVGVTSLVGLISHARSGRVQWKTGLLFGGASMIGAWAAGTFLAPKIPAEVLLVLFGGMMLVTAIAMMRGRKGEGCSEQAMKGNGSLPLGMILAEGLVVGAVTGLVGAGGGFLVVPALVLLGRLPMGVAVGTSLLVIGMKSFAGFAGYLSSVPLRWSTALLVVGAAVVGSFVGSGLVSKVNPDTLRRSFGWFIVAMAVFLLGQEVPKLLGYPISLATHWPWLLMAIAVPTAAGIWKEYAIRTV